MKFVVLHFAGKMRDSCWLMLLLFSINAAHSIAAAHFFNSKCSSSNSAVHFFLIVNIQHRVFVLRRTRLMVLRVRRLRII